MFALGQERTLGDRLTWSDFKTLQITQLREKSICDVFLAASVFSDD